MRKGRETTLVSSVGKQDYVEMGGFVEGIVLATASTLEGLSPFLDWLSETDRSEILILESGIQSTRQLRLGSDRHRLGLFSYRYDRLSRYVD